MLGKKFNYTTTIKGRKVEICDVPLNNGCVLIEAIKSGDITQLQGVLPYIDIDEVDNLQTTLHTYIYIIYLIIILIILMTLKHLIIR